MTCVSNRPPPNRTVTVSDQWALHILPAVSGMNLFRGTEYDARKHLIDLTSQAAVTFRDTLRLAIIGQLRPFPLPRPLQATP